MHASSLIGAHSTHRATHAPRLLADLRCRAADQSPQPICATKWSSDLGGRAADRTGTPDILRDRSVAEVHRVTMAVPAIPLNAWERMQRDPFELRLERVVCSSGREARSRPPVPPDEAKYLPGLLSALHRQRHHASS